MMRMYQVILTISMVINELNYGTCSQGSFSVCVVKLWDAFWNDDFWSEKTKKWQSVNCNTDYTRTIGTIIYSDQWLAYTVGILKDIEKNHETIKHSEFFVDPITDVQTHTIECIRRQVKTRYRIIILVSTDLLNR